MTEGAHRHWCMGCPYGRSHGELYFCIFVSGSCAKIPPTMNEPDTDLVTGLHMRTAYMRYKSRIGHAARKSGAEDKEGETIPKSPEAEA